MAKRGTEDNPIRLRSIDGAQGMSDDTYVVLTGRQVRYLQEREPYDPRPSNHRELHSNDSEVPPIQPDWNEIDRVAFARFNAAGTVIEGRHNISGGAILTDTEKVVMLAKNCMVPEMKRVRIADAMKTTFNEIRSIQWRAEKAMGEHFHISKTSVEDRRDLKKLKALQKYGEQPINIDGDDADVVLQVRVLRVLQGESGRVRRQTASDLIAPKKEWKQKEAVLPPTPSDYRELHRLMYGTDPVDDESFQNLREYIGCGACLTDKQRLYLLAVVALTKPLGMYAIARAMNINKNHVILLRRDVLAVMKKAPPALLCDERVRKAQSMRPVSLVA